MLAGRLASSPHRGREGLPSSLGHKSTGHSTLQTAAPSPRAPPKAAPCPPICASALALREPGQPFTGSEQSPGAQGCPRAGHCSGPTGSRPRRHINLKRPRVAFPEMSPAGKSSPNLTAPGKWDRAQAAALAESRATEPGMPPPATPLPQPRPSSRRLGPEHTSSPAHAPKTGSSPSKVASGQMQGRQASLAALMGTPVPPALPWPPLPTLRPLPVTTPPRPKASPEPGLVPQCPDQKHPTRGTQLSTASEAGTGQTPNQRPGLAGERGAWPSSQSLWVPKAAGQAPEWTEGPHGPSRDGLLAAPPGRGETGPGAGSQRPFRDPGLDNRAGCSLGPDLRALNPPWGCLVCGHRSAVYTST